MGSEPKSERPSLAATYAAARVLDNAGRFHKWWPENSPRFEASDPICRSEFLGLVEQMLIAAKAASAGPVLRYSHPKELNALHSLWRRSVEATHSFLDAEHLTMISDIVRDIYLPSTTFRVAVNEDDQPIAFLGGEPGTIDALFVDPDWFGKGVGRALLERALAQAPVVRLDVNEANAQARRFYERMGFVAIGRSALDSSGMPYPLIHMEWRAEAQPK